MSTEAAVGFEERAETPWCIQCDQFLKWPYHDECLGCLTVGGRPADTVSLRTVHWDTAVLHAVIRRKVAVWEQRHPGWELMPDFARYWEDSTHPSKYVDRDTAIGRKLAWTRFRVERRHPRGRRGLFQGAPLVLRPGSARWTAVQEPGSMRASLEYFGLGDGPVPLQPALARAALHGLDVAEAEMDAHEAQTKELCDE